MKLIDGEWLADELFKHHVHDDEDLEPLVYLSDAQNLIATAPTVDAIPLEWLDTAIGKFMNAGRSDSVEIVQSLIRAWRYEEWLKEQLEAQLDCMARKIFEDMDEKDRDAIIQKLGYVPWQNEQEAQDG